MLHRLCGPPSIPLSFTLAGVLPRRLTYRVCFSTELSCPTPSEHRLLLGLPGYLIRFAPLAFGPQRQGHPSRPASPLAFLPVSTDFTPTQVIPSTSGPLKSHSFMRTDTVEQ